VRWTHIGSARFAAACPTACRSGDRRRANHVHAAADKEGPSDSHEWSARRWCPCRSGSDGRTRGPAYPEIAAYPEIDIGASQTDSALMRGTVAGEGPARPRRCQCPRVKRIATLCVCSVCVRLGCHKQKFQVPRECFRCPTMGHGTRLGAFTSRSSYFLSKI
jgi:hypothetical protein